MSREILVKLMTTRAKRAISESLTFTLPKVRVKVNQGTVRGCQEKLPDGRPFFRFSGIPFAKPPVNELRFQSPQKLLKFNKEEIDCTREGDMCRHKHVVWRSFQGSEDCLHLNVYTPADKDSTKKFPVMVFIHGGGFGLDSNRRDFYSPEYLVMEDVIVVTVNYRLHVLGWASLPSMGISGNAGLKDQQMALEWVNENIANFNGDPNNVTLFGESAGAACTHLHLLNKKSKKFVNKAILQSGTANMDWVIQRDGPEKTRRSAIFCGSKGTTDREHYEHLMKADPDKMYLSCFKVPDADEKRRAMPMNIKPVLEQESDDAFITKLPIQIIKENEGKYDTPLMIGCNNGDGMTQIAPFRKKLQVFANDMCKFIPISLNIDIDSDEAKKLAKRIEKFYFGDRGLHSGTLPLLVNLCTDYHFAVPMTLTNELYAKYQPNTTQYVYELGLATKLNFLKIVSGMADVPGAGHFDELCYLFDHKITGNNFPEHSREYQARKMVCHLWTNFAKYGEPTPNHDTTSTIKWHPARAAERDAEDVQIDYLTIDNDEVVMKKNLYKERIDFWRSIYEEYNGSFENPMFQDCYYK